MVCAVPWPLGDFLVYQAVGDGSVAVDAAVAQERPVASNIFQRFQINVAHQDFFAIGRGFRQYAAERITEKRRAPELQSLAGSGFSAYIPRLEANSIHDRDVNTIGDSVGPLNRAPSIVLGDAELSLLRGMPADRRRV